MSTLLPTNIPSNIHLNRNKRYTLKLESKIILITIRCGLSWTPKSWRTAFKAAALSQAPALSQEIWSRSSPGARGWGDTGFLLP